MSYMVGCVLRAYRFLCLLVWAVGHINNLYNTTFWAMVQKGGMGTTEAEAELKGTISGDKNEILFSRFGINYNNEESIFKKGSVVYRNCRGDQQSAGVTYLENSGEVDGKGSCLSKTRKEKEQKRRAKAAIVIEHVDIIKDEFWETRPWLLGRNSCEGKSYAREL
ncbi:tRNA-His guanylyltransferase [Varicellaria rhodocarpa]|nr:tRNA-His guanylyltransferase [Varicellaria rhodocarpa]